MSERFKVKPAGGNEKLPADLVEMVEQAKIKAVNFYPEEKAALRIQSSDIEVSHER